MKHTKFKILTSILLVAAVLVGIFAVNAFADTGVPTVNFDYSKRQFTFSNVSPYGGSEYPDLFTDLKNLMPGDSRTQKIKVTASSLEGGTANMYLRVDKESENKEYIDLLTREGVTLTVSKDGKEIASGDLEKGVFLGKLEGRDALNLDVTFNLPLEAGNDLQNKVGTVDWVFTAEYIPAPIIIIPPENPPIPELEKGEHYAYIIGRDDGLVHPEDQITRAEVATIFFRLLTEDSRDYFWTQTNPYSDVAETDWFNNAVSTLSNAGVINGRPGNVFDPTAPITRAEFAAIAVRFFGGEYDGADQFSDIAGHWANSEINRAYMNELIKGYPDGTFRPDNYITRAEAMTIVNRVLERKPDKDHLLEDMVRWADNTDTEKWYYADVQEATNSHDFEMHTKSAGDEYELWTELRPVRDWAALEKTWSENNSSTNPGEVISSNKNSVFKK